MATKPTIRDVLDSLPKEMADFVRTCMPASRRLTAARARLGSFRSKMKLRSLGTGTWRGTSIEGEEIHIQMKADSVAFEQSRVELHVGVELDIQVPAFRKPKIYKLGPVHESVATPTLPRINITALAEELSASFVLSSVQADEVTADVEPIADVDAGDAYVHEVEVEEFEAPADGFTLSGVRVGPIGIETIGAEAGSAERSRAGRVGVATRVRASDVVIKEARIIGGRAMAAKGDDLNLGFEVQLPALNIKTFPAMPSAIERLVTRLSVRIEPRVIFQIGKLHLDGMSMATRVGTMRVKSLSLPVDVKGVELEGIELSEMDAEDLMIGEEPEEDDTEE